MKEYEVVREIFNACAGDQRGDVTIEELELDSPDTYIAQRFPANQYTVEKTCLDDGSLVYTIAGTDISQKYTFTEI